MSDVMHAMSPSEGGIWAADTLCGETEGWRAQIPTDVTCLACMFLIEAEATL